MTELVSSPCGEVVFSLHSMVTSREVRSPSSCGLAMQVSVNSLFGDVVIVSGEVSTDRPTTVSECVCVCVCV